MRPIFVLFFFSIRHRKGPHNARPSRGASDDMLAPTSSHFTQLNTPSSSFSANTEPPVSAIPILLISADVPPLGIPRPFVTSLLSTQSPREMFCSINALVRATERPPAGHLLTSVAKIGHAGHDPTICIFQFEGLAPIGEMSLVVALNEVPLTSGGAHDPLSENAHIG